jgi:predicted 3-demethylubiquinone-9 3-methyltransferase (glyoxalase superfamily)
MQQQIIPFIWFDGNAEEAVNYYVSLFKNSKIDRISRYGEAGPLPAGTVMTIDFQLDGQDMMALNGGPGEGAADAPYPGSVALFISCETQADVDRLWDGLRSGGGESMRCGWVKDRFGVVWNVVPRGIGDYVGGDDEAGATRAMQAMLQMDKLDIDELRRAYEGVPT